MDGLSARRLACYRAEFRFCFQHDDFRDLQMEVLIESGVRKKDVVAMTVGTLTVANAAPRQPAF